MPMNLDNPNEREKMAVACEGLIDGAETIADRIGWPKSYALSMLLTAYMEYGRRIQNATEGGNFHLWLREVIKTMERTIAATTPDGRPISGGPSTLRVKRPRH